MKLTKKLGFISTVAAALLFSGCGEGGGSSTPVTPTATKIITVERGPLLDANVTDALGHSAVELGNGEYAFDHEPEYPITATGGYIDIDRNGVIDAGEVKNELELKTQSGDVVTMATTLASDENKTKILQEQFELTQEQIQTQTPSQSQAIEAFSNTLYAYSIENGYKNPSEISTDELEALVDEYKTHHEAYKEDGHSVGEHEQELMDGLSIVTLDDADAQQAQEQLISALQENQQEHEEFFHSSSSSDIATGSHSSVAGAVEDAIGATHSSVAGAVEDAVGGAHSSVAGAVEDAIGAPHSSVAGSVEDGCR
jgi:hypothetical protein